MNSIPEKRTNEENLKRNEWQKINVLERAQPSILAHNTDDQLELKIGVLCLAPGQIETFKTEQT